MFSASSENNRARCTDNHDRRYRNDHIARARSAVVYVRIRLIGISDNFGDYLSIAVRIRNDLGHHFGVVGSLGSGVIRGDATLVEEVVIRRRQDKIVELDIGTAIPEANR